ncbi:hypothetical protein [Sporosarcina sp. BI001-red]|uniref:hypothetical protein n=1 Tax=Sporosarcina sp. BI001-red TaxID=2282866 RepID=UPI0018F5F5A8|nr:hypothetical protein [Sporosarcina sp. BI001-red]
MKKYEMNGEQVTWLRVKEEQKSFPAKRVDIVSVRLVKEKSLLYKDRSIKVWVPGPHAIQTFACV